MSYQYKMQVRVCPSFGAKYWCDMGPVYEMECQAYELLDYWKANVQGIGLKVDALRIVSRPVPEWQEVEKEVFVND